MKNLVAPFSALTSQPQTFFLYFFCQQSVFSHGNEQPSSSVPLCRCFLPLMFLQRTFILRLIFLEFHTFIFQVFRDGCWLPLQSLTNNPLKLNHLHLTLRSKCCWISSAGYLCIKKKKKNHESIILPLHSIPRVFNNSFIPAFFHVHKHRRWNNNILRSQISIYEV